MQLTQYINLKYNGVKGDYAKAMGFRADQVSRFCRDVSCIVEVNGPNEGWPHPSFKQRNKVK